MVSGPYRGGAKTAAQRKRNLAAMTKAALALFRMGHVPVIGVNLALPVIEAAGGAAFYDEIMMPLSLGADDEVARVRARSPPVYRALDEVPAAR